MIKTYEITGTANIQALRSELLPLMADKAVMTAAKAGMSFPSADRVIIRVEPSDPAAFVAVATKYGVQI
jgi:hypothetical protein